MSDSNLNKQQRRNKPQKRKKPINVTRLVVIFLMGLYIIVQLVNAYRDAKPTQGAITYNELIDELHKDTVDKIDITENRPNASVIMKDGHIYDMVNPKSDTFIENLMKEGADVIIHKKSLYESISNLATSIPMILIMLMLMVYILNTVIGGSTKKFTVLKANKNDTTFDDIKGITETKNEVKFLVDGISKWKELGELGARPVKGVLFYGPAGTGKTMLARAIAKEANVPFISACGSDFVEMFVGVGAARIRSLWQLAEVNAPCILFIDEIDSIGKRHKGGSGENVEMNQTINCLLQQMDGLEKNPGVMVIAATNRMNDLDQALLRSGRFDRKFYVGPPTTKKDRDSVVELYLDNKKLGKDVTLNKVSKLMTGLTAADIDEALSDAVYISLMDNRDGIIELSDIDEAVMKLHTKGVKKEHTSKRDEEIVAIHEAGHTIMSLLLGIKISKTSIIPYSSGIGGVTIRDLDETGDIKLKLQSEFEKDIKVLLAGKIAEELEYGEHTQGCSNDINEATKIVYSMVTELGYGNRLLNENTLIDNGISHIIQENIMEECNKILVELNRDTTELLKENFEKVKQFSKMLLKNKTIVEPTLDEIK